MKPIIIVSILFLLSYQSIGQNNKTLEDLYEEVLTFDKIAGFTKVKKYRSDKHYLWIDTSSGKEYILAENLEELTSKTTALNLYDQGLDSFPREILKHTQLEVLLLTQVTHRFSKVR